MTDERTFTLKVFDIRTSEDGKKVLHIRTKDDYRFAFECGDYPANLIKSELASEEP